LPSVGQRIRLLSRVPTGLGTGFSPMTGFRVPQLDERQGDGRQAACLVGREAEVDRNCAFAATARTDRRGRPGDRRARCRQDRAAGPTTATRHAGWGSPCANTTLFIVGSPKVTTPVIEAAPLAALDLPLRVVVREDGYQTEDQLPRHRPRLRAGTGSTPIWPGHWRASTRGPAPW